MHEFEVFFEKIEEPQHLATFKSVLERIINFNMIDKQQCTTFWRK